MVDESLWSFFHRSWRQIDADWRGTMTADTIGIAQAIEAEREALRAEVRKMAPGMGGPYLVPV